MNADGWGKWYPYDSIQFYIDTYYWFNGES